MCGDTIIFVMSNKAAIINDEAFVLFSSLNIR